MSVDPVIFQLFPRSAQLQRKRAYPDDRRDRLGDRRDPAPPRVRRRAQAAARQEPPRDGREHRRHVAGRDDEAVEGDAAGPADPRPRSTTSISSRERMPELEPSSARSIIVADEPHLRQEDGQRPRQRRRTASTARRASSTPRRAAASSRPATRREQRRVVFLGDELAKDIFGEEDPVGKTLLDQRTRPTPSSASCRRRRRWAPTAARTRTTPSSRSRRAQAQFGRDRLSNLV